MVESSSINLQDIPEIQSIPEAVRQDLITTDEKDADAMLARELYEMSIQEREGVYETIHGVERVVEETDELVDKSLYAMNDELSNIHEKKAYELGLQLHPDYVTSRSFRIMFLRADHYDPVAAARRMVRFMEHRLKWFGPDSLGRPLLLSDLSKQDMDVLRSGMFQILPSRDTTGRLVYVDFQKIIPERGTWKNQFRAQQYVLSAALEDEEAQIRGIVAVHYYIGKQVGKLNHNFAVASKDALDCLPLRIGALHGCINDPILIAIKPIMIMFLGRYLRSRLRLHEGSHNEVQYMLMTYGIPVDTLPVSHQGDVRTANHKKWLTRRKTKDDQAGGGEAFHGIDLPSRNDVILRRGRVFHDHPGNLRMRMLVETHKNFYGEATPEEKEKIAKSIVKAIKDNSGKFLERGDDGWWVEVSDKEAVKRVCKAIRSARSTTAMMRQQKRLEECESNKRSKISFFG